MGKPEIIISTNKLKALLVEAGVSQKSVAEKLKLSAGHVSLVLSGQRTSARVIGMAIQIVNQRLERVA